MNRELKDRKYTIPRNIIDFISSQGEVDGVKRNKHLIDDGEVTYGQLKRILHDMKYMDRRVDEKKYKLYGGDLMWNWGNSVLSNDRNLIKNRKEMEKNANEVGDIEGDRNPSYKKRHTKKDNFSVPTNLVKSNSSSFSFASQFSPSSLKLFENDNIMEEINRIKELMI